MKFALSLAFIIFTITFQAQNPCDFSAKVKDSIGEYRSTKEYLVYERNFAGNMTDMYFSLALTDGLPTLNMQLIQKSRDFVKTNCLDKNSRVYLQLDNGKIVTLIHIDQENCGSGVRNNEMNNRILSGYFLFPKETFSELKNSPVSLMRIKYSTETVDYIFRSEIKSETDDKTYHPADYFINTMHCLDN
jgi:hypothetical protein